MCSCVHCTSSQLLPSGILPLDSPCSGLCDVIDIDEHYLGNNTHTLIHIYEPAALSKYKVCVCFCSPVQKPEKLSSVCVAAALRDGLCAYTALHTHARVAAGHTLLVLDGASVCINNMKESDVLVT